MQKVYSVFFPILILLTVGYPLLSTAQVELGKVHWERDLGQAILMSQAQDKPVFILFQEVPGCHTCRQYGQTVLSHPMIVEAIESLFIPVAIFNNKKGKDAEVLTFFHEPSWNNPVVRIVDSNKQDIAQRVSGNYTALGIAEAMAEALSATNRTIPEYLKLLKEELNSESSTERIYLSMYCFWTGEKVIGGLEGVVHTEAGFMDGHEVVEVDYNPSRISVSTLTSKAAEQSCADDIYVTDLIQESQLASTAAGQKVKSAKSFRKDNESKYYIRQSPYRHIPMTQLQAVRTNSALGRGQSPIVYLSPQQVAYLSKILKEKNTNFPDVVGLDLETAWKKVDHLMPKD